MRTAQSIKADYIAATYVGKADGLTLNESADMVEVICEDTTGHNTYAWAIYVDTTAKRQVPRLYIPRTGEEYSISVADADAYIMGIRCPLTNPYPRPY